MRLITFSARSELQNWQNHLGKNPLKDSFLTFYTSIVVFIIWWQTGRYPVI